MLERAIAHDDVVLLAAGKIIQRERILGRADHAQIALDPRPQAHARFSRPLCNDRFDQRMPDEHRRNLGGRGSRHDEIEIAHDFLPASIAARDADVQRLGVRAQIAL
jgi:hypothetical protein